MNWQIKVEEPESTTTGFDLELREGVWVHPVNGMELNVEIARYGNRYRVDAGIHSHEVRQVYLVLEAKAGGNGRLLNFDGPVEKQEIYRQSPHDVDAWFAPGIARQAVPMVAVEEGGSIHVALHGSPALFDNACSQYFDPEGGVVALRTGDDGATPGRKPSAKDVEALNVNGSATQHFSPGRVIIHYHEIGPGKPHKLEAVIFKSGSETVEALRQEANCNISEFYGGGPGYGKFGSLAFSTAWMNLRMNESGKSRYWVVPAAEYSNIQYNRDAFWIATMLDPEMDRECLLNELADIDPEAEYPLLTMVWCKRVADRAGIPDRGQMQACMDVILGKVSHDWYRAYLPEDGRHDFQYWQDSLAFLPDDSITYNQGFLALALRIAEEFGLDTVDASPAAALANYRSLFNRDRGFVQISKHKPHLFSPDCLLPDLVANVYLGEALLDSVDVAAHFSTLKRHALTLYGFKVLCREDADYPSAQDTTIPGYISESQRTDKQAGDYQRGGSWFHYDCMCLLDCVLHGVPGADDLLVWRVRLEMDRYGTTHEYLNTVTGQPHKPNMGWNVALYALLCKLSESGRIEKRILEEIDV